MQHSIFVPYVMSLFSLVLLFALSLAAPPTISKESPAEVKGLVGPYDDDSNDSSELAKRLSNFVRIGRPSNFVRIGRGSSFVRIGRPGHFIRIGRGYDSDVNDLGYDVDGYDYGTDKRGASHFVRIGKASKYGFVRIGKADQLEEPSNKRMSSFVRIGRPDPYVTPDNDDVQKRATSSFVRIGRIPSSAFVRIGRDSGENPGESEDFGTFDRIARMGQSSFVRIGKREADPEKAAAAQTEKH